MKSKKVSLRLRVVANFCERQTSRKLTQTGVRLQGWSIDSCTDSPTSAFILPTLCLSPKLDYLLSNFLKILPNLLMTTQFKSAAF